MNCPACGTALEQAQRQGVEIDICPQCRGVWLDRGEIEKLVNRTDADGAPSNPRQLISDLFKYTG